VSVPVYGYLIIVAAGWLLWFVPFPLTGWSSKKPERSDNRARWGILLEVIGYSLLWQGKFWARSPGGWRIAPSIIFFALAALLSWTGTRALGRHLRFDAALSPDHQLVRSGPYRVVRHPIYTSMLCLLLGTGCMITSLPVFAAATLLFLGGTEIRVRIEDGLLASRFGDRFRDYQRTVSAYIPLVR
jgi:protein-S-isoprenylcysteine O-methyltransferase Ste14